MNPEILSYGNELFQQLIHIEYGQRKRPDDFTLKAVLEKAVALNVLLGERIEAAIPRVNSLGREGVYVVSLERHQDEEKNESFIVIESGAEREGLPNEDILKDIEEFEDEEIIDDIVETIVNEEMLESEDDAETNDEVEEIEDVIEIANMYMVACDASEIEMADYQGLINKVTDYVSTHYSENGIEERFGAENPFQYFVDAKYISEFIRTGDIRIDADEEDILQKIIDSHTQVKRSHKTEEYEDTY